jgi:hypothetical protein
MGHNYCGVVGLKKTERDYRRLCGEIGQVFDWQAGDGKDGQTVGAGETVAGGEVAAAIGNGDKPAQFLGKTHQRLRIVTRAEYP